jgi:hypothetical protein
VGGRLQQPRASRCRRVFEPLGFVLRPEVGAISMAGASVIVALNAVALKRLRLADQRTQPASKGRPMTTSATTQKAHAGRTDVAPLLS